jgi:hypothetical protein
MDEDSNKKRGIEKSPPSDEIDKLLAYFALESKERSSELTQLVSVVKDMAMAMVESNQATYVQQPQLNNKNIDPNVDRTFDYLFSSYVYFQEDPIEAETIQPKVIRA